MHLCLEPCEVCTAFCFVGTSIPCDRRREDKMAHMFQSVVGWLSQAGLVGVQAVSGAASSWLVAPIVNTFRFVYFNGPARLGFWHGVSAEEACAQMTRVPSTVWERESDACENLLSKDFRAMCIGAGIVCGALCTWKLLDVWIWMCALQRIRLVAPPIDSTPSKQA